MPGSPTLRLGDVMAKRVVTMSERRTMRDAARLMQKHTIGSVVVVREKRVVGIVTERDVLAVVAAGKRPEKTRVADAMSAPVIVSEEAADLQEAIKLMVIHNIKKLPVLRGKRLVGIVTLTDFARIEPIFHDMFEKALLEANKPTRKRFQGLLAGKEPPPGMYV